MTHEAGIEAAAYQFQAAELDENNGIDDFVSEIIQAYLSASGMVLMPREPTDEILDAANRNYPDIPTLDIMWIYSMMVSAAPDPFKSKPSPVDESGQSPGFSID